MQQWEQLVALFGIGALAALGRLLIGRKHLDARTISGTLIVGGCLGLAAALILIQFPSIPVIVMIAAASALSTLGYEVFKAAVEAFVFKATGKDIDKEK